MEIPAEPGRVGWVARRVGVPVGVSVVLATAATLGPPEGIVTVTVPVAILVSVRIAHGEWRLLCLRIGAAIALLAFGALAAWIGRGTTGALVATLPAALAVLFCAMSSALEGDDRQARWISLSAVVSVTAAALLVLVTGLESALGTGAHASGGDVVPFAALLLGAPGLLVVVRVATPWPPQEARNLEIGAVAAFVAALLCVLIFAPVEIHNPVTFVAECTSDAAAAVLLMQCAIRVLRESDFRLRTPR